MFYEGLAAGALVFGALIFYSALRLLSRSTWLLGWLRGTVGILLISLGVAMALIALDVFSYQQLLAEKSVATLSFEKLDEQEYKVVLVDSVGLEQRFILKGDQWQLDARLLKWSPELSALGLKAGFRLDRISGRYYSLEQERNAERTVFSIRESEYGVDLWSWANRFDRRLPFVDAVYGSATFVPMDDGALFEVSLSNSGLLARPLNESAEQAVSRWQ